MLPEMVVFEMQGPSFHEQSLLPFRGEIVAIYSCVTDGMPIGAMSVAQRGAEAVPDVVAHFEAADVGQIPA